MEARLEAARRPLRTPPRYGFKEVVAAKDGMERNLAEQDSSEMSVAKMLEKTEDSATKAAGSAMEHI